MPRKVNPFSRRVGRVGDPRYNYYKIYDPLMGDLITFRQYKERYLVRFTTHATSARSAEWNEQVILGFCVPVGEDKNNLSFVIPLDRVLEMLHFNDKTRTVTLVKDVQQK